MRSTVGILTKGVILVALLGVVNVTPADTNVPTCKIPKAIDVVCTYANIGYQDNMICVDRKGQSFNLIRPPRHI